MNYTKNVSIAISVFVASLAVLVLLGWQFDKFFSANAFTDLLAMNPLTAVLFLALSIAIILFYSSANSRINTIIKLLTLIVIVVAGIKTLSFFTNLNTTIDQWFFYEKLTQNKGKLMAPNTALNFVLLAAAVFVLTLKGNKNIVSDLFAVAAGLIGLLSVLGYIYDAPEFYQVRNSIAMAFHTAVCFMLLAITVVVKKKNGLATALFKIYAERKTFAIVIPVVIVITVLLGYLRLRGERLGYFSSTYGTVLFTLAQISIFIMLIWLVALSFNQVTASLLNEIAARKKFENKLKENNLFLNTIMENIPLGLFVKDVKSLKYLRINRHALKFLGLSKEQVLGKTDYEIFPKDEADFIRKVDTQALTTGRLVVIEEQKSVRRDQLHWLKVQKFPVLDSADKSLFLIGTAQDITSQKKNKDQVSEFSKELEHKVFERTKELEKSERRFRSLIENSVDAIQMMDSEGTIFFASRSNQKIIGYTPEELFKTKCLSHVHPDDFEFCSKLLEDAIEQPGITKAFAKRFIHKNQSSIWVEGTITNLLQDESVNAIVCNYHDISDRLKTETEKRNLEIALENENQRRQKQIIQATIDGQEKERTSIGMELHDNINQILGAVKLYIGVARNVPETINEMLEKSSQNIDLCINEIRKLSKNLVNPNIYKATLNEAITSIIDNLKESTDIRVTFTGCDETSERLDADKKLAMYRIVQELVTNVINHAEADEINISLATVETDVVLVVSDNGKGFDTSTRQKGIGLSNIKSRIEVFNGELLTESTKNKGSRFTIKIPV